MSLLQSPVKIVRKGNPTVAVTVVAAVVVLVVATVVAVAMAVATVAVAMVAVTVVASAAVAVVANAVVTVVVTTNIKMISGPSGPNRKISGFNAGYEGFRKKPLFFMPPRILLPCRQ